MTSRIAAFAIFVVFSFCVWAVIAGPVWADSKDQTQGQKDAHNLACVQAYYACIGNCSQAVSLPLSQACKDGCNGRLHTCQAKASVSNPPQLNRQLPKQK